MGFNYSFDRMKYMLISLSFYAFFIALLDFNRDFLSLPLVLDSDMQCITSLSKPMIHDD